MDFITLGILVVSALLPAIVLCTYVFIKDRVEKEPIGLLLKLLLFGVLSVVPVLIFSPIFSFVQEFVFYFLGVVETENGIQYSFTPFLLAYHFVDAFIVVALLEEGFKLVMLLLGTKKNKNFNSLFDGMIYAIFVSLGFAALENLLYVLGNGFSVAVMRSILSVPGHMFFAVMMGYYYSFWHITDKAKGIESSLKSSGLVPMNTRSISSKKYIFLSLIVPVAVHGLFDFCLFVGAVWSVLLFLALVIFLYIYCFGRIRKMSKADGFVMSYAKYVVIKKYPHLADYIRENF